MLRLADALGIARAARLVCPGGATPSSRFPFGEAESALADMPTAGLRSREADRPERYAVVHAAPMFVYKRWSTSGWRDIAAALRDRGLTVVATGGPDAAERAFLDEVWAPPADVVRLDGRLSWPQLTNLLEGARAYVGPDTAVTHLAAASGCPTVALFGPTDPRLWGPIPAGGLDAMWQAAGTIQRRGNVWLVQNPQPCLPCHHEGCDRNLASRSRCLDELPAAQVMRAVDQALAARAVASPPSHGSATVRQAGGEN